MKFINLLTTLFPTVQYERSYDRGYARFSFIFLGFRLFLLAPVDLLHERVELCERNVSSVLDRLVVCLRACASPGLAPLVRLFFGK